MSEIHIVEVHFIDRESAEKFSNWLKYVGFKPAIRSSEDWAAPGEIAYLRKSLLKETEK